MRRRVLAAGLVAISLVAPTSRDEVLSPPVAIDIAAVFDAPDSEWGAGHRGIDLFAKEGQTVRSPGDGVVTFAGDVAGRGVVVVLHASGLRSTLEPVTPRVAVGNVVAAGDLVGVLEAGASHCAPSACLHWGVKRGELYLDPLDYLGGYGPIRLLPLREVDP